MAGEVIPVGVDGVMDRDRVRKSIEADGYAVLQAPDGEPDTLRRIGAVFGTIQSHIRADERGVVGVGGPQRTDAEWHPYRSEYHGLGTGEVAPHSDGTFVDGAVVEGTAVRRVGPPRFVLLHLVRHADEGGANVLVDGQRVFDQLLVDAPDLLRTLLTPGSITFCRDDQLALDKSVFHRVADRHVKLRFRGDSKAFSPSWAVDAVRRLQDEYHFADEFRSRLDVREGQVLVIDNTRMLHGRDPFSNEDSGAGSGRKLHRIWILDDHADGDDVLLNLHEDVATSRALAVYAPYGPVANEFATEAPVEIDTGIRLTDATAAQVDELLATPVR